MTQKYKKKLRIAMVCDPVGDYKAGAIVSALRFGAHLQERGHTVIFIGARLLKHPTSGPHGGMMVHRFRSVPLPKSGGWRLALPSVKEVKKILTDGRIDVVHIILPMSAALVAVKAARELGIKIVAHSHSQPENLFMDVPKYLGRPMLDKLWNRYLAWLYSKAESVVYPSQLGHELLHHLTKEGKPHLILSNGVNTEVYRPMETGDFHERFAIPRNTVNITYVGRLFPEKSVDTLIKAVPHIIKEHPETHFIIVGIGYLRPKLEALTKTLGVQDRVSFLTLEDDDKILAYNAGDIFISPSFAELEGMTVLEAMACGKPVIISDTHMNAARFFVTDNGLLFKVTDHIDLSQKVLHLIKDAGLRKRMGDASLKKSREYDILKSIDLLEGLYHSLSEDDDE